MARGKACAERGARKSCRGRNLAVVRFEGPLERRLIAASEQSLDAKERTQLLNRLQAALSAHPRLGSPPAIVVDEAARLAARRLIALEFPEVPVLARQELLSPITEQPFATLTI